MAASFYTNGARQLVVLRKREKKNEDTLVTTGSDVKLYSDLKGYLRTWHVNLAKRKARMKPIDGRRTAARYSRGVAIANDCQ